MRERTSPNVCFGPWSFGLLFVGVLLYLPVAILFVHGGVSAAPRATLEREVESIVRRYGYPLSNVSISAIDHRGKVRVALNGGQPFKPASNMKVVTTAAALSTLGPDYKFRTELIATSRVESGKIDGDLILRGTGDPNISGRFFDGEPTALLERWAAALHDQLKLTKVTGDLIVDDSFFDDELFLSSWKRSQEGRWYSAQVSPLSFNDNCIDVVIVPAGSVGSRARVEIAPATAAIQVSGSPKTVGGRRPRVTIHRKTGTNEITVGGKIGKNAAQMIDYVTVEDPALFFGTVLTEVFKRHGIVIEGVVRRVLTGEGFYDQNPRKASANTREGEVLLVSHTSTVKQDLPVVNKRSQNLHAEILLKSLGARVVGEGSREAGATAIREYLTRKNIATDGIEVVDGSGLSHGNRVSSLLLARVLDSVKSESYYGEFKDSLAIAGKDGTLKRRFKRYRKLLGRVYGKTGAIAGVSALSGYLVDEQRVWCFSILVNRFPRKAKSPRDLQEAIVARLAEAAKS